MAIKVVCMVTDIHYGDDPSGLCIWVRYVNVESTGVGQSQLCAVDPDADIPALILSAVSADTGAETTEIKLV